ncbi:MAG: AAA family ATPase [Rhodocyclaceae bacterium]|nr:AAA family ATPase [Zoogloeaceae bacterium]MCP5241392.1 AAA family ATPase [Zoogloeaceae bacterium]MCP5253026.1 AAA family ATPase [Zoogloeaceae bacterium]MCW5616085.1 AAA family ATPase [Rhodocyclaceae bacterium]
MDAFTPSDRSALRSKLAALCESLQRGLVERGREVRLSLLAALAGEHTLLIGPPGTAKSELARRLHLAFGGGHYVERLLTRFTVPEELFGPLSISALEQDRYERHTAGYLPQATIAFIDEVFKANSAILNALLTLLNEREFDNGSERLKCPLISVIGATNAVPDDEVGEAFFDRFLLRLPVAPVSSRGFAELLAIDTSAAGAVVPIDEAERRGLAAAASRVSMPREVAGLLSELRGWLAERQCYVSDRRWVKIVGLLRTAAASEGRDSLSRWDLWLLPWCVAADAAAQTEVDEWLGARLGSGEVFSPLRVARVVEAFEAQLEAEQNANDLDYDEAGRLRVDKRVDEINATASDGKGASQVLRMSRSRRRSYGRNHLEARLAQIDALLGRLHDYAEALAAQRTGLEAYLAGSLWLDAAFARRAAAALARAAAELASLSRRAELARSGFEALPRLDERGTVPAPVAHDPLDA